MKDFFVSYNSADRSWAEWIAWVLEENGYSVVIQAWDFRPGGNFILDMQRATAEAKRTVMVLSDAYLQALYTQPEWAAAFKQDPTASDLKLLPIQVEPCQLTGMLAPLVYVDLVGKSESEAEQLLLAALKDRDKPTTRPIFPQPVSETERVTPAPVAFPGAPQTLPFPRNLFFFTGRGDLLEAIHTMLSGRGRVALLGLGGIGKTQIALEYVYRRQSDYEQVFWVRTEQKEELISGYVALAKDLQLPGCQQEDQLAVVHLMKQWLTTHDGWLLVLDNADDLRHVRSFLPTASGHILMTTRAQALGDIAQPLAVNQMEADEGALFLLRRARVIADDDDFSVASETDQNLARCFTREMDGLPLALDQAGAYIEEQMLSLEEYLELFQTEKAELLKERGRLDPNHPSVTVTFTLAFEKVATANAISADLVRACAFLSPDAIPEEIFSEGAEALGEPLSSLADSKLALTKAISEAARFSLISRNRQTKTLTIHRLVQAVLRAEIDREKQKGWADKVMQAVTAVFPNAEYENWPQCDRVLPHVQSVTQLMTDYSLESATAALLLSRVGYYFQQMGRYNEAERLYLHAAILNTFAWFAPIQLILDWYHLEEKCKKQLSLALKGRKIRNQVLAELSVRLWQGLVDSAIEYLQQLAPTHVKDQDALVQLIGYLRRNYPHIPCYCVRKRLGLRNSSNKGEKSNDLLVSERQKHNGMSWSKWGSVALAAITTLIRNREYHTWFRTGDIDFKLVPHPAV